MCVCDRCNGVRLRARVVDHIIPHRGDGALFWDESNWQGLAKSCHDRKTATHDGGFGRASKEGGAKVQLDVTRTVGQANFPALEIHIGVG